MLYEIKVNDIHCENCVKRIVTALNETGINNVDGTKRLISIIPINYEEYARLLSKPWKQPLKNQGWRLFQSTSGIDYISDGKF